MTIILETKALRAAAQEAAGIARGAETIPILSNVLIEAEGAAMTLTATDLDSQFIRRLTLAQPVGAALAVTVSARFLAAIAAKLPQDAQVSLDVEDSGTRLRIAAGRARFVLPTLPTDDFPRFAAEDWTVQFEMPAAELAAMIDAIAFAISTEETRYYLNGIFFHRFEGEGGEVLRCAATDGHRLARYQLPLPAGAGELPAVIVPRKALGIVRKMIDSQLKDADAAATAMLPIALSEGKMMVEIGEAVFTTKLIDGQFPDYSRVIPVGNDKVLKVRRGDLREAVARVASIVSERTRAVRFDLSRDLLKLEVSTPEAGTATEELPCDFGPASAAAPMQIGFNAKYLDELLGHIDVDDVAVELGDPQAPTLWRDASESADGLTRLYVLMPLRV